MAVTAVFPAPPIADVPDAPLAAAAALPRAASAASEVAESPSSDRLLDSTVGQLVSADMGCTATMVNSPTGRVAVTAAHCVYVPQSRDHLGGFYAGLQPGWRTGMTFVPGRIGDNAPFGVWDVAYAWIDRQWQDNGDLASDVAFIELADSDGHTAQQELGAQGISFEASVPRTEVTLFGYPTMPPFDGTTMRSCAAGVSETPRADRGTVEMDCDLTGGASGGPWLAGLTEAGVGAVVAVSSFKPLHEPGRIAGIRLGPAAQDLWRAATRAP
jgi:V8-like Glu-specific endopeptidase